MVDGRISTRHRVHCMNGLYHAFRRSAECGAGNFLNVLWWELVYRTLEAQRGGLLTEEWWGKPFQVGPHKQKWSTAWHMVHMYNVDISFEYRALRAQHESFIFAKISKEWVIMHWCVYTKSVQHLFYRFRLPSSFFFWNVKAVFIFSLWRCPYSFVCFPIYIALYCTLPIQWLDTTISGTML